MARNHPIKILWYGSETDAEGNPIIPEISPSFEKRLEGLNEGEIYIHNDDKNPSIYIRTNKDRVVAISGSANIEELSKYFLRKDKEDTANGLITFLKGIVVKSYLKIGEFITGVSGGYIDENGNLEMESGVFRKRLFVPEIAYNRTTYFKGRMVNSPGGGCSVLSYVDNGDGTYTITPDLTDADGLSQFVDDILTTYFVTKNSEGKLNGFEEMKFRVTAADYTAKKFTVIPRPGHSDWKPAEQMVLAQTGNFTDPERQTYILIDSVNGNNCITFFDNANTWDPEPAQMPAWFGKKKGMTVAGINADNYSAVLQNIIMTGLIFQVDEITGQTVRVPLDKGEWTAGKYAYYNRVSHNGALWLCVDDNGTTTEPSDDNPAWLKQVAEGQKGDPGLSVVGGGHWESSKTPYKANTMVTLANCVFLSKVETSNPPIRILRVKGGNFLRKKDGGYYLAGKPADWEVNEDWDMLLDGRELKGESITFLGEFATAPANPKNGDSYRNTTDRATYIYQDGRWQLMISDGKDGKDYEYIYTRGNIIDNPPEKPDSQQKDDYIPEGWTDDFVGVDADHQVEWGCTRFKENGVWSEFSTPAVVHRWSKDGENAIMADFDNEMVNAALTSDGKVVSSQTWNTTVSMWYGTEKLTLDSITCTPDTNLLCATDKNTGVVTISVSAGATLAATNTVRITIMATKNGQQYSRDLTFTVAGVRGGADGSDAVLYSIIVSASSVSKDKNGNYSVSSVSCYRQKSVGGVISTTTDGILKYSIDGGAETTINNNTAISSGNFTKTLKFVFYVNDQIVDVETVPMLVDGKDGENAIMADFDNEMVNAALTSDGKVVSSQTWNTTVSMWYGTEKLTLDSITCTPDTNLLCATDKNTGVVTISVSAGATLAATNTVRITIMATKNGQQYSRDLTFTVAGVRGGADGSDAVLYSIIVSASSVSKDKNGNYSVSSVSCYRQKSVGGVISTTTDGILKYSIDGGAETTINNNTAISSGNFTKTLKFVFYVNDQIVDVETVPMLVDGKDGADGESITAAGHWESANTPYAKNSTVSFAGGSYLSKVETSNPPIKIAKFRNGRLRRKRDGGYILAGRSANRTVHADWQEMVAPVGPSASYWLDSPVSVINFTSTGTPSPSGFLVTCKQNVAGNVSTCSTLYLAARKYNGSWLAHVGATLSNQISVPATAGYTQFAVRAYKSASDANAWNNNFVAEKGVGVANDGAIGATGATGAFPRDRGVFASGQTYVWNADYRDKVIYLIGGVYYNFLVKNYGASVTAAPTSVNGDSNWEAMQKFVNIATDTLFADGANVAGFMFKDKVLKSFNDKGETLLINGETGYFKCKLAEITGTITADKGRVGPFSIISGVLSSKILYENETNKYVGFNLSAGQIEFYNEMTFANVRIGGNTQFVTIEGIKYDAGIDIQSPNAMIGMHIKTPSIPLFVEGGNIFLHPNNDSYVSLRGIVGNWRNISVKASLNNNDDNVMFINRDNIEVTLPPDVPGHTIYFKRMSGGVRLTGGRILPAPGGQEVSYIDLDFASGFIKCMGNYWVMFYCG